MYNGNPNSDSTLLTLCISQAVRSSMLNLNGDTLIIREAVIESF